MNGPVDTYIRCASGLGDSIYLRGICEHFARAGRRVVAISDYPEIFEGSACRVEPFRRTGVDIVAHYVLGKVNPATNQWQDVCRAAGVMEDVPFTFDWPAHDSQLVAGVRARAAGRPMVLVQGGRTPMARKDRFGAELLPRQEAFEAALEPLRGRCYLVAVGKAEPLYPLAVDEDLTGQTSVPDLLDLFRDCDAAVSQCGFAIPMAEIFDRPLLVVWAAAGLTAAELYVRQITPAKVLSKPTSAWVMDDWGEDQIRFAAGRLIPARERAAA